MMEKPTYEELEKRILELEKTEQERKRTEEALRLNEDKYHRLFELESDALFLIDNADGRILEANRAASRMYGYTREELLELCNVDLSAEQEATRQVTRDEIPVVPVRYHRKKDGSIFPVEIMGSYFEWRDCRVHLAAVREIDRCMQTEEALRESEERFRTIFQEAPVGISIGSAEGLFLEANNYLLTILGYAPEEIKALSFMDITHPEDRKETAAHLETVRSGKADFYEMEKRHRTKDGDIVWVRIRATALRTRKGEIKYWISSIEDITEKRKSRMQINRLLQAIESARDGIWITDREGTIIFLNWAMSSLSGFELDALNQAGDHLSLYTDHETVGKAISGALAGRIWKGELTLVRKDRKTVPIEATADPIFDDAGTIIGVIGVHRDISERKAAERALKQSEEKFRLAFENAAIGRCIAQPEGPIVQVNNSFVRMLEMTRKELEQKTWQEIIHPEFAEKYRQIRQDMLDNKKQSMHIEIKLLRKNGGSVWVRLTIALVRDAEGVPLHLICDIEDITEQKMYEKSLKESEERYRRLYQQAPVMLNTVDPNGRIMSVNNQWLQTLGYRHEEVIGHNILDFITDESKQRSIDEVLPRLFALGFVKDEPYQMVTQKGSVIDVLLSVYSKRDPDGKFEQFTASILDISDHKRSEEERARLEQQVVQVQKLEAVGRLAGGIAHDLNNLLSPILGYGELLLADADVGDPRKKSLEQILRAGMRARDLVRQLLAFSRKQTLEYRPLDLNQTLTGFEKLLRRTIREDIDIQIVQSPNIRPVMADIGQIEQVIMNLAINGADAMPGGGKLTIETLPVELDDLYAANHPSVKPGAYVMLAVSDTGCGMDEEIRKQIFEPFFSTKGKLGTGLGLATVYGIVKQHGGNIWAYSEPGKGTTFKVYLPVSEKVHVGGKRKKKTRTDPRGSETILLVEDNQQVRDIVQYILERQGYSVLIAKDGMETLKLLESHKNTVDLLLTDVVMPEMNGRELYAKVAAKYPALKVLYMSGYTNNVIAHHGVLDEGVQFIQKPFTAQALGVKVRKVFDT